MPTTVTMRRGVSTTAPLWEDEHRSRMATDLVELKEWSQEAVLPERGLNLGVAVAELYDTHAETRAHTHTHTHTSKRNPWELLN